ncbi:MAG: hypothetical protein JW818_14490 [Pirellulales bacterium]|nr:hypothetical protein [Pirellulales bacterium]
MNATVESLARAAWTQAWQVTLLILFVAVLVRLIARRRPHLAHVLWLVVLIKCVMPPLVSSPSGVFCWLQPRILAASSESIQPESSTDPVALSASVAAPGRETPATATLAASEDAATVESSFDRAGVAVGNRWSRIEPLLFGVWIIGVPVVLGVMAIRWTRGLRRIRQSAVQVDAELAALLSELARRLGVRRSVRWIVTREPIGPAVVGLWRPTVVLPQAVTRGATPEALTPILAHELIHIRRGDLAVGLLQMVVQAAWWFHPLVWWACRRVALESERCCDEAVVAELGQPARYARALLDVLSQKRTRFPLSAVPGVRPVEVTSIRLERIMKLGQGCRKRSPWWCWMVMLGVAAIVLPGGALMVQGDSPDAPVPVAPTVRATHSKTDVASPKREASVPKATAKPLQVKIQTRFISAPSEAMDKLGIKWQSASPGANPTVQELQLAANAHQRAGLDASVLPKPTKPTPYVYPGHGVFYDAPIGEFPVDKPKTLSARATLRTVSPMTMRLNVLDKDTAKAVLDRAQEHRHANILQAPVVATFSGQTALVADTVIVPLYAGTKDGKALFQMIDIGTKLNMVAIALKDGRVRLETNIKCTNIETDKTGPAKEFSGVRSREIETGVEMKWGQSLAVLLPDGAARGEKREPLLVMLQVDRVAPGEKLSEPPVQHNLVPLAAPPEVARKASQPRPTR